MAAASENRDKTSPNVSNTRVATEICRKIYTHVTVPSVHTENIHTLFIAKIYSSTLE